MKRRKKIPRYLRQDCYVKPVVERVWQRLRTFGEHHLTPRSRGGSDAKSNLLRLDKARHKAWHFLFANTTLVEIIKILKYILEVHNKKQKAEMNQASSKFGVELDHKKIVKSNKRDNQAVEPNLLVLDKEHYKAWEFLFGNLTLNEVIYVLERIKEFKRRVNKNLVLNQ